MFKSLSSAVAAIACFCLPTFAAEKAPEPQSKQAGEFEATATLVVSANGDVVSAEPDPSVPEVVRELLKKRVAQWKFAKPTFQGRPAQISAQLKLRLQLAPTTGGGYGVRIIDALVPPASMASIIASMRFTGRPSSATLVYVVEVDTEGRNAGIELVLPKRPSRSVHTMDYAARASIKHVPPLKRTVDGQPVACRDVLAIHFLFNGPPLDYAAETKAIKDSLTDKCPETQLLTEVAGTTL